MPEYGRPGHEHGGPRAARRPRGADVYAAIHFEFGTVRAALIQHRPEPPDFLSTRGDVRLPSEPRVYRHDQSQVDLGNDLHQRVEGCIWIERHTRANAQFAYALDGPVQVRAHLLVNRDVIGPGIRKRGEVLVGFFDHQVHVDRKVRSRTHSGRDRRSDRDVGDEVTIHDVDVNPVRSRFGRLRHLLSQTPEVRGKNGW